MESKWEYQLTQKADADLDDIVGYIAVELANPKAASDFADCFWKTEHGRNFASAKCIITKGAAYENCKSSHSKF